MAEEAKKKAETPPAAAAPAAADKKEPAKTEKPKGGLLSKTPVLLGGVMVLEAAVLIGGFKFLNRGRQTAQGAALTTAKAEGEGTKTAEDKKLAEIPVVEFRAPNKQSGRTFLYDVSIFVAVKAANAETVKTTLRDRDATVKDRIRTIIAQSDPEKLGGGSEPGLETLRRQIKYQLDEILGGGESQIEEILVARCIPFRADY